MPLASSPKKAMIRQDSLSSSWMIEWLCIKNATNSFKFNVIATWTKLWCLFCLFFDQTIEDNLNIGFHLWLEAISYFLKRVSSTEQLLVSKPKTLLYSIPSSTMMASFSNLKSVRIIAKFHLKINNTNYYFII